MNMEKILSGKNALITGASRGIGKAIAGKFLAEGARVAIHYNSGPGAAVTLKDQYSEKTALFKADFTDLSQTEKLFNDVIRSFGHLDILVNNAGMAIGSDINSNNSKWIGEWKETIEVNLNSAALLCKAAINHFMKHGKGGIIINIASRAAFRGDRTEYMAYAASKGGLVALTRSIARAFGKHGIVAFTVAPGFVKTEMADQFIRQYGESYAMRDISLNRITVPDDIAPLIAFLASGQADHATGGTFDINAGSYVH